MYVAFFSAVFSSNVPTSQSLCLCPSYPDQDAKTREVLDRANSLLRVKYGIEQVTLQVEEYSSSMEDCHTCQNALPKRRLGRRTS